MPNASGIGAINTKAEPSFTNSGSSCPPKAMRWREAGDIRRMTASPTEHSAIACASFDCGGRRSKDRENEKCGAAKDTPARRNGALDSDEDVECQRDRERQHRQAGTNR